MAAETAISVKRVSKSFRLPHERTYTLKSAFLNAVRGGSKSYSVQKALSGISFDVKKGEFFGIVGRNGSGKSTLLKLLAGIYQPTKGTIGLEGRLVPFIELGVGFNGELTGRENVYLNGALFGFTKSEIDAMYPDIVGFAELDQFMDQKLKNYSSGMQVRLAFSMATRAKADILLVDEVLAVGDADFQRKCFDYFRALKKSKTTVVFVSHDMNAVREYCDRAILIEDSKLVFSGTAEKVASEYIKMFTPKAEDQEQEVGAKRWGTGAVRYTKVKVRKEGEGRKAKIIITTQATAKTDVESPIFGFLVRDAAGNAILGTNNQIAHHDVPDLKAGESIEVEWQFDNILSDGKHYVEPSVILADHVTVFDWWEEAATFRVYKEERTPYGVTPVFDIKTKLG
jgi:ABC-2 type transport system ATP-binding protein